MTYPVEVTETQSQKATTVNEALYAVAAASLFGRKASTCSGLTWGYHGGYMMAGSPQALTAIADGTVTLSNGENYIEATTAGVVINKAGSPSGFTTGRIPLYIVQCSGGLVTSYTDVRCAQWAVAP